MSKLWYVVHAYSNYEHKVCLALQERIDRLDMQKYFGELLVPTETVIEMRKGQKRQSERKFFPGYILVEMEMNDASWHLVKETPKVLGFIGGTKEKPAPITKREADIILQRSDLLVDLNYYSTEIQHASFVFPTHIQKDLTGIAKR